MSAEPTTESNINGTDLRTLIADFQYWRSVPGHFEGASWNSHVDAWNGTLHKIMQALDEQVEVGQSSSEDILALLGEPDLKILDALHKKKTLVAQVDWQGEPISDIWVFNWRGNHDQYLISVDKGIVVAKGWYMALE
ncbi:hypothetical protein [Reinekea sp. G2M2-21]|uniref:hypothetical protein n=1 Tax=Reinekea sp. G2M2-21 TaxID=2788942 RepID=UPI0018AB01A8|nr:hypothetical protein [Reinekea sp. G2M2-21]